MPLRLYNTLTKKEEIFSPIKKEIVTMYTCGPTVYGRPHIGNYSSFLMADLLRRWLEAGHGLTVTHVKNITDVGHLVADADQGEDKVEKEARRIAGAQGRTEITAADVIGVARNYESEYLADEHELNFLEPAYRPRASEFIPRMREMITALISQKNAYVTEDGIYFSVTSKTPTPYGTLSGNTLDNLSAGARVDVREDKKHPADFALWKFCVGMNEKHLLRWESPENPGGKKFPEGFPGWHIECSAMSSSLLGDQIDIHTGGEDNIFPHHECEIAQSESVTGKKPFVHLWLHRRRIQMGEEKMSKSIGNVLNLSDIIAMGYDPMDLRYYLLSVHYRTNLKFTEKGLDDARKARTKIAEWMGEVEDSEDSEDTEEWKQKFSEAMDSDLNTPEALAVIFQAMAWSRTKGSLAACKDFMALVRQTFGCFAAQRSQDIPKEVVALLAEREAARKAKNFGESDRLRDAIAARGYELKDTAEGQKVRKVEYMHIHPDVR
ncbi:cysteine--tRNA ligase [Candidatus Peregrinibacteria bacterium]|nr:cysteine--tRNA ligase [Candidatus Peregrinibacteria bacterium]